MTLRRRSRNRLWYFVYILLQYRYIFRYRLENLIDAEDLNVDLEPKLVDDVEYWIIRDCVKKHKEAIQWAQFFSSARFFVADTIKQNSIWNRQKKRSFSVCEATVKLHFIVPRQGAEKPPQTRTQEGGGLALETSHRGLRLLDPIPPFRRLIANCVVTQFDFRF